MLSLEISSLALISLSSYSFSKTGGAKTRPQSSRGNPENTYLQHWSNSAMWPHDSFIFWISICESGVLVIVESFNFLLNPSVPWHRYWETMLVSGMEESDGLRKLKCSRNLLDTVSGLVWPKEFPALSCRTDFLTDHSEKLQPSLTALCLNMGSRPWREKGKMGEGVASYTSYQFRHSQKLNTPNSSPTEA